MAFTYRDRQAARSRSTRQQLRGPCLERDEDADEHRGADRYADGWDRVEGNADGVGQLVWAELHQTASRKRDRRKAKHRGIPATGRNIEGIDQPAVHFIGDDDRCDQPACAGALGFGDCETRRNVVAGMNGEAPYISIVEVEVTECGRIREGGERLKRKRLYVCRPCERVWSRGIGLMESV